MGDNVLELYLEFSLSFKHIRALWVAIVARNFDRDDNGTTLSCITTRMELTQITMKSFTIRICYRTTKTVLRGYKVAADSSKIRKYNTFESPATMPAIRTTHILPDSASPLSTTKCHITTSAPKKVIEVSSDEEVPLSPKPVRKMRKSVNDTVMDLRDVSTSVKITEEIY